LRISFFQINFDFVRRLGYHTGCPKNHRNSVTNWISSLLWISIVIPYNIIMSARVYFMKRVKDFKDVSIMSQQDEQWRRTSLLCLNRTQSKHKQTCEHSRRNFYRLQLSQLVSLTKLRNYLKRRIRHWIPMFIGTPCTYSGRRLYQYNEDDPKLFQNVIENRLYCIDIYDNNCHWQFDQTIYFTSSNQSLICIYYKSENQGTRMEGRHCSNT